MTGIIYVVQASIMVHLFDDNMIVVCIFSFVANSTFINYL